MKKILICFVVAVMAVACAPSQKAIDGEKQKMDLVCTKINEDFKNLIPEIDSTSSFIENLYLQENMDKNLKNADKNQYAMSKDGVFYKPNFASGAAVFVSGAVPIDEKIKEIVYFTSPLDEFFKEKVTKSKVIAQIYYNDKNSYNRIYPGFDVLSQYQAKMDIPSFNFYYLADATHNPSKKAVWVNEPYVDPAGRGWMISLIKPVYVNGEVEGVPGIDITINAIIDKYLTGENEDIIILSQEGTIVAVSEKTASLLSLPALKDHKYIETIKSDTYLTENFNLLKSKKKNIRTLALEITDEKKNESKYENENEKYIVVKSKIDELKWIAVKFIKK